MGQWISPALHEIVQLVADGTATSRAALARHTGLARSTVSQHVDVLLAHGIIEECESRSSARGRPARALQVGTALGTIAAICVDTSSTAVAIASLSGVLIDQAVVATPCSVGPKALLPQAVSEIRCLLEKNGYPADAVRHVVAGLPAPVDFAHGCAVRPPIMPGWDGYPVGDHLRDAFVCPTIVDNDANLVAVGESSHDHVDTPLIAIKVAAGIGAGIINADGAVHRGADGAAGDIGHIRISGHDDVVCKCGNTGCLEAVTSYDAVLRALGIAPDAHDSEGATPASALLARLSNGDTAAIRAIRAASAEIGQVAAILVHAYNPRTLVLVGPLAEVRDELLAGVRAAVYERALPLATRKLTITTSQLGSNSEIVGAIALGSQAILSPAGIDRLLSLA